MKSLKRSFIDLLFPPLCLHCSETLKDSSALLCQDCLVLLEMIDPSERCPYCFSAFYQPEERVCEECQKTPPVLHRIASAFDYAGPAASLLKQMKYGNQKYLAKSSAAFMTRQFLQLDWPMPDIIIPVPIAFNHWIQRGYNQCDLLADHLGEYLNRPVIKALSRKSGDFSQAALNRAQRLKLTGNTFTLRENYAFHDKNILLIDDVMTTGATLGKCAEQLFATYPASIYGLTLCRAVE